MIPNLLRERAFENPDQRIYSFLADGEREQRHLSYAELDAEARSIAALLRQSVDVGERALLLYPPGLEFISAFFGCLYGGVVAVPAYPPGGRTLARVAAIVRDARPAVVLTTAASLPRLRSAASALPALGDVRWLATDEPGLDPGGGWTPPEVDSDALAFLQYTSGSTASPKGVMVSHGNLAHNEELIRRAFGQSETSVVVGWLPMYHDMGLIGNVLQPLYSGGRAILMSPVSFLQRPSRWLEAVSRYRATTSGGPNFAYELCARKVRPETLDGLDLGSWQVAFNGSEPVRSAALRRFAERFAPCGFRPEAFFPCYGLAEGTLFVSGGPVEACPRIEELDAAGLEAHRVSAPAAGAANRELVGCGRIAADVDLAIVDPQRSRRCGPAEVGEIWLRSPSVAGGYWGRRDESQRDFGARLSEEEGGEGPFLRTGDLGFMSDGELFVTGRIKDLIILRGRNHYPQDIELTAERAHPALRPGCVAAFAVDAEPEERLVLVWELERRAKASVEEVADAVRQAVAEEHEVQVYEVVLVRVGSIPKTSSGKIRRHAAKNDYQAGRLAVVASHVLQGSDEEEGEPPEVAVLGLRREVLRVLRPEERLPALIGALRQEVAKAARVPVSRVAAGQPLSALGVDSLAAVELQHRLVESLGVATPISDLLAGPSLESLGRRLLDGLEGPSEPPLDASPEEGEVFALSHGQRALYFLHQLAPESTAYHIAAAARVEPRLRMDALRRVVKALAERHPALRTTFHASAGEPEQRIQRDLEPEVAERSLAVEEEGEGLSSRLESEADRPFDLASGPLLRWVVFHLASGGDVVLLTAHHIVADFWSLATLTREMAALYAQETGGPPADLAPLPVSFRSYVGWQRSLLAGDRGEQLWAYWRRQLAGAPPVLDLPADRVRPPVQTYDGAAVNQRLSAELSQGLEAWAQGEGYTLFSVLLAAFQALLHRYTGQDDLWVGTPVVGRTRPELGGLVGYFTGPVVLRGDLSGRPTFRDLSARTWRTVLGALEHQDFPFPLLAERLQPERDASRSPLFQVMFVFQALPERSRGTAEQGLAALALGEAGVELELDGLRLESVALGERTSQFDLSLRMARVEDRLVVSLQYNRDLFDGGTIRRLSRNFSTLLAGAVESPDRRLESLSLLAAEERAQLLGDWNGSPPSAERPCCLHELFEEQTRRTPEAEALVAGRERLTYRELEARANRLAHVLRRHGVGPEVRVGVCLERTAELVVGLLAVLKAGGAYVPIDTAYPVERRELMLADSGARLALTRRPLSDDVVGIDPASAAEPGGESSAPPPSARPENVAYVIYTSGSTGRPKGVAIEHRSAAELAAWAKASYSPRELSGVLASTSVCFDLSVFELFVPLAWGGRVILAKDALELPSLPAADEVTLVNTVPSAMSALVERELPPRLETVNLAGEPLKASLVAEVYARPRVARVWNLYGPSEDTTYSTGAVIRRGAEATIGRPLPGSRAFVVDRGSELVPIGVPGELWLGGPGLARGYLERPGLTAARFVPHPFTTADQPGAEGERLYRTGDLARWLAAGELEFLGRVDRQIKVRGYRVEPGEVESVLEAAPGVREAAVVARSDPSGSLELTAFVVPEPPAPGESSWREHLARRLPAYMVPPRFVTLAELPLLPNGKVDRAELVRRSLPVRVSAAAEPARGPQEEILAGLYAQVLGLPSVGVQDHFFELGGHSLLAMRLVSRVRDSLGVELPVSAVFETPDVGSLAARIRRERTGKAAPPALERQDVADSRRASFAQQRLWFLAQLEPESTAYHVPARVRLSGALDTAALEASLGEILRRHDVLRATFQQAEDDVYADVADAAPFVLPRIDLSALSERHRRREAERRARDVARLSFDLAGGPLVRAALLTLADEEHELVVVMHHIASDGGSLEILLRELAALYEALAAGRPAALPELPVRYADFAAWQRQWMRGEVLAAEIDFWKQRLSGLPPSLDLPTDRPRSAAVSYAAAESSLAVSADLAAGLEGLSRDAGVTLFMTLLAAFQALLVRHANQTDVAVGSPVAGRNHLRTENLIGLFVNTLVLRSRVADDPSFARHLSRAREETLSAFDHQDVPFERLVEELQPVRELSRSPLFQAMFVLQTAGSWDLELPNVRVERLDLPAETAKFDLTLTLEGTPAGLLGRMEFPSELFDATTVERLTRGYRVLLEAVAEDPARRLSALSLSSPGERHELLTEWNGTASGAAPGPCLHEMVAAQAGRTPEAEALVARGERLTYAELDARSGRLARVLRHHGVGPEVRVGISLERTADLVVSLLAVLKAGGAYVPIDPAYPEERRAFMLADSGARLAIARSPLAGDVLTIDPSATPDSEGVPAERGSAAGPENLAYVIYTSGSTGRPKGVAIEHRGAVELLRWARDTFTAEEMAGVLASTSVCFDLSVFEIFAPLAWGGRVLLVDDALALDGLAEEVTLVNTVPSAMRALVETRRLPETVRTVNLAGEPLTRRLVEAIRAVADAPSIWNLYGPSEDTTYSTAVRVPEGPSRVTVGRVIKGGRAHVVDRRTALTPFGVPGELLLAGPGLARGYPGRPATTARRFVPDPFGAGGARLYRTGDLVRWLGVGELDFLGRIDHQVKVRGFRIELGEVDVALAAVPGVDEAVTVVRSDLAGGPTLVAYVVAKPSLAAGLREHLARTLPGHMVPPHFVVLEALPLLPNGKVDRKALPRPAAVDGESSEAPRSPAEEIVAGSYGELLGLREVGRQTHFFERGGHSLLATQLVSRIRTAFKVDLPVRAVFEAPTVAGLTARVEQAIGLGEASGAEAIVPIDRRENPPLSFAQQRLWFLEKRDPGRPTYNLPEALRLEGPLDERALARSLSDLVRRHEALRTTFRVIDGTPCQVMAPRQETALPVVDLTALPALSRGLEEARLIDEEAVRPFDLVAGPLLRTCLLRLSGGENALVLNLHHIIADGWSIALMMRELTVLYRRHVIGEPSAPLPELTVQYADYAAWQRSWLQGEVLERQLEFWRGQLEGAETELELPTDRPRPRLQSHRGGQKSLALSTSSSAALARLSREQGSTLFISLTSALGALLSRYTGQREALVGFPIANRHRAETEGLVGFFVNTLVLRVEHSPGQTWRQLLDRVRDRALGAYAHQDLPFEKLVEAMKVDRNPGRSPLFQVMLALQNAPAAEPELEGLRLSRIPWQNHTVRFDLSLRFEARSQQLRAEVDYCADLFDAVTIERLSRHYRGLLRSLVEDPSRPVAEASPLSAAEHHELLLEFSDSALSVPLGLTLHEGFERWVEKRPDQPAVRAGIEVWSYRDLDEKADRLARRLRSLGVGPECRVGLYLEFSPWVPAAILGTLKAGAAFVPLDPSAPPRRLDHILRDAGIEVVVTTAEMDTGAFGASPRKVVAIDDLELSALEADEDSAGRVDPRSLAYVIYTSGSTGLPKGVMVEHRSAVNYLSWINRTLLADGALAVPAITRLSFDASLKQVLGPLLRGAEVWLEEEATVRSPRRLLAAIAGRDRVAFNGVPTLWEAILAEAEPRELLGLTSLMLGGEAVSEDLIERTRAAVPGIDVWNLYGPTEATVNATVARLEPGRQVSIGRPLGNMSARVTDRHGRLVAMGVHGELHLGGIGLARGYVGRPAVTAEGFVPDAQSAGWGERLYRTGDLVRRLPSGELQFLGRIDHQVKVRGFRIELGEIESVLAGHPAVRMALVIVQGNVPRDRQLVAYLEAAPKSTPAVSELRELTRQHLPDYMTPAFYVVLKSFPRTSGGKIDRSALPSPEAIRSELEGDLVLPRNPVEEVLAGMMAEVLGVESVGIYDSFFELGGHSLLAAELVSMIEDSFEIEIPLFQVFEEPTVAGLSAFFADDSERREKTESIAPVLLRLAEAEEEDEAGLRELAAT